MKRIFIILMIFMLLFSGCSLSDVKQNGFLGIGGGSSTKDGVEEVDKTGKGLEIDFSIDDNWISSRRLEYELSFKNSGLNPVEISKDNFKLTFIEQDVQGVSSPITQDSLKEFYNEAFLGENSLELYNDQEIEGISGILEIDEDFFKLETNTQINYQLDVEYNYETEFSNNLEIDMDSDDLLDVMDSLSQAAPVNLHDLDLARLSGDTYILRLYFKDNGPGTDGEERSIRIDEDMNIKFRDKELSNCKNYKKYKGTYVETSKLVLNSEIDEVVLACEVDLDGLTDTVSTTTIKGSFSYDYKVIEKGKVELPEIRNEDQWI